jgi:DNA-binding IclR family transcriptional regulator
MARSAAHVAAEDEGRGGIQVIARAAAVLRVLKHSRTGLSLAQIADRVHLPRSTVQRIVSALQEERLVAASSTGVGFFLGPELHALAEAAHLSVADALRPLLKSLSSQTSETVDLAVLRGETIVFIDQVAGTHRLRAVSSVGETFTLCDTANGKACLALLEDAEVRDRARAELGRSASPARMATLMSEIAEIRRKGYAFDLDEHTHGISAVGIAFRDQRGDCHAISIPVPTTRFAAAREKLVRALLSARREARVLLGL